MTSFGFDGQESLDQMNFPPPKRPSGSIPHVLAQEPPCLVSPGELVWGEGLSFAPSFMPGDCSKVLQYKPKSNIVPNVLFYPA